MKKLSDLIKVRLDKHNLSGAAASAEVLHNANLLLADLCPEIKNETKAYRFSRGILFIATENSALSQEVWGVQIQLIQGLNKDFGNNKVKKIVIKNLTIK